MTHKVFPYSDWSDQDITSIVNTATHFEFMPMADANTMAALLDYDFNVINILMGQPNGPAKIIAQYHVDNSEEAFDAFFRLAAFKRRLYYNGREIVTEVINKADLVVKVADNFNYTESLQDLESVLCIVGVSDLEESEAKGSWSL